MIGKGYLYWWGFRLRSPLDYDPKPVTQTEKLAFFSVLSLVGQWVWLAVIIFSGASRTLGISSPLIWGTAVPLCIFVGITALGLLTPVSVLDFLRISPWIIFSREKGDLQKWNFRIGAASAVLAGLSIFRMSGGIMVALLIFFTSVVIFCLFLSLSRAKVDFLKKRWKVAIPEWLRIKKEKVKGGEDLEEEDVIIGPDPDASPVYEIHVAGGAKFPIGVYIPTDLLNNLRAVNAEHGGTLYQQETAAAVLVDRPPVAGLGQDELVRLCEQIMSVGYSRGMTRYELANTVLNFVQDSINYQNDENSTSSFPGGPYKEYGRFAVETVHDGVGDCECTALLCLSLLSYLGFRPALVFVTIKDPDNGEMTHHAAVGLDADGLFMASEGVLEGIDYIQSTDDSGRRYLYGETAVDDSTMAFGVIPSSWKGFMTIENVIPIPELNLATQNK